jgi:tetratricopeptide (TPR) repeat protein
LNKYEDAIKKLEKAIELKPDYSDAYLNLGISLNALDKYEDAIKNFKIALELEPDFMEVYFN